MAVNPLFIRDRTGCDRGPVEVPIERDIREALKDFSDLGFEPASFTHGGDEIMCIKKRPVIAENHVGTHFSLYFCLVWVAEHSEYVLLRLGDAGRDGQYPWSILGRGRSIPPLLDEINEELGLDITHQQILWSARRNRRLEIDQPRVR